ncbi:MAG: hypothetical protein M1122_00285 [Candidatus Marsarchaeota archaeon]|nr:hypothetical protein [Candidatus Marsarchaeota archaeon]
MLSRLQSAMEYLITYGWSIVIIAVIIAALAALGIFSPGKFSGQECNIQEGLVCQGAYMMQNGTLSLNVYQATQYPINITAIGCNTEGNVTNMQSPSASGGIYVQVGSNVTLYVQCYTNTGAFSGTPGTQFSGFIIINYTNEQTYANEVAQGKVNVEVT